MPITHLREVLGELHEELERSGSIDDETREMLREAKADIEDALLDERKKQRASTARTRIGDAIERFENDHPEGVALLQRVLHALSNVGL